MNRHDEFRVELSPDLQNPGAWKVHLVTCPLPAMAGAKGTVTPAFTRAQLRRLRGRTGWPNLGELQAIGRSVWQSLMTPQLEPAFDACVQFSRANNRGLRLSVVVLGQGTELLGPESLRPSELPVEVLYRNDYDFLAVDQTTPVSRGLQTLPDRPPHTVSPPLQMLAVVSAPADKPPAQVAEELQVIRAALQPLTADRRLVLEFCDPPTKARLRQMLLDRPYHILHFIGHGGFDPFGTDPTPRAHVCMVRDGPPQNESDPLDAVSLSMLLRNTEVRLVVLTACSSAAAAPNEEPYKISAFDGLAQRLLGGVSGVTAVVAMQFDMESDAARRFSESFYSSLFVPGLGLDEVVGRSRHAVALQMDPGHRSWVTPVVYWRCTNGRVFDVKAVPPQQLDPQTERDIEVLKRERAVYLRLLEDMAREPPAIYQSLAEFRKQQETKVDDLETRLGALLGESLRLRGGRAAKDQEVVCRLTLRLGAAAVVDQVQAEVEYPAGQLQYLGVLPGAQTANNPPVAQDLGGGRLRLTVVTPSNWQPWPPGEYEVGQVRFRAGGGAEPYVAHLKLATAEVRRGGAVTAFKPLDGVVFRELAV